MKYPKSKKAYFKDLMPKSRQHIEKKRKLKKQREERTRINKILLQLGYPKYLTRDETLKDKLYEKAKEMATLIAEIEDSKNVSLLKLFALKSLAEYFITALGKYYQLSNIQRPTHWLTLTNCALKVYHKHTSHPYPKAKEWLFTDNKGKIIKV